MSKYIDKDKVLEYIIFGVVGKDITCGELTRAIESLPTIEVSEDCISRKWLEENAKEFGDYENTVWAVPLSILENAPSVVPQVPSEDCISREDLLKHAYKREGVLSVSVESIKLAPSVTTEQSSMVGEWLLDGRCSECLASPLTTHKNYCPNCGAKMKG